MNIELYQKRLDRGVAWMALVAGSTGAGVALMLPGIPMWARVILVFLAVVNLSNAYAYWERS